MRFENWFIARIEENKELFTYPELQTIYTNIDVCKKVYMIAMKNISFLQ